MSAFPSIVLEKAGLGLILLLGLVGFAVMSAVFSYHWTRFGLPTPLFRRMTRAYFWIAGVCVALAVTLYLGIIGNF